MSEDGVRHGEVAKAELQPIRVEVEREADGRVLASVPDLPGVMAYGADEPEAVRKVKAIAIQVLADLIVSREAVPAAAGVEAHRTNRKPGSSMGSAGVV